MCGLFGFAGTGLDIDRLTVAAMLASKRGPDGWGIVTATRARRALGRFTPAVVRELASVPYVVGHCRLATVPDTRHPGACQPLQAGARFVVAHNGVVANVDELGVELATGNDSEAIAALLERTRGPAEERIAEALDRIDHGGHYALAVLDLADGRVHLRASGIPLWVFADDAGLYWCSIRPGQEWEPCRG